MEKKLPILNVVGKFLFRIFIFTSLEIVIQSIGGVHILFHILSFFTFFGILWVSAYELGNAMDERENCSEKNDKKDFPKFN